MSHFLFTVAQGSLFNSYIVVAHFKLFIFSTERASISACSFCNCLVSCFVHFNRFDWFKQNKVITSTFLKFDFHLFNFNIFDVQTKKETSVLYRNHFEINFCGSIFKVFYGNTFSLIR